MDLNSILQVGQILAYLVGIAIFIIMLKADIRILRHDMAAITLRQNILNEAFSQLTSILTTIARQDERIKATEDDIRDLRHGRGLIITDDKR